MKFFTKEVKIAIVTIIGIVVLFYGLQFLKGLSVFGNADGYYVSFTDAMLTAIRLEWWKKSSTTIHLKVS